MRSEPALSLAELQRRFHELVTAPEDVRTTLARGGRGEAYVEALVRSSGGMSAVDRLDIYANMYFFRIRDVLAGDYAKVAQRLGEAAFHNLCTDYLVACPPRHASLRDAGDRLPAFLATHELGRQTPWLADLARLERARIEVFDAADAEVLELEQLRRLQPEAFGSLAIRLIPAHAIVPLAFDVLPAWQALEEAQTAPEPAVLDGAAIVWRQGSDVYHRLLDGSERRLRPLLEQGTSFALLCEQLLTEDDGEVTERAFQLLARWVLQGLLVTVAASRPAS